MSHGGKGDTPRPLSVSQKEFNERHETIFGKKPPRVPYVYVPEKDSKEKIVDMPKDSTQGG
jgi:hypothetical protein